MSNGTKREKKKTNSSHESLSNNSAQWLQIADITVQCNNAYTQCICTLLRSDTAMHSAGSSSISSHCRVRSVTAKRDENDRNPKWMFNALDFLCSPTQLLYTLDRKHQSSSRHSLGSNWRPSWLLPRQYRNHRCLCFIHPVPYHIPPFINVTVLHYNVFTKAVHNWLLVD